MREYETIFVTRPDISESQTTELLAKVDGIIKRHGGEILQQKNWGRRELAYRVQKQTHGVYQYYNYASDTEAVADLERTLRLNELPMKFLTVKLSDNIDVKARLKELADQEKAATEIAAARVASESVAQPVKEAPKEPAKEASKDDTAETKSDKEVTDA
jgi:small subunit ribosomal protein S6